MPDTYPSAIEGVLYELPEVSETAVTSWTTPEASSRSWPSSCPVVARHSIRRDALQQFARRRLRINGTAAPSHVGAHCTPVRLKPRR